MSFLKQTTAQQRLAVFLSPVAFFCGYDYNEERIIADGIRIRFTDAGHLLGSASIELWLREDGVEKKLLFSGDIGNINQPLICDPTYPVSADYVVMESTYGDRSHEMPVDYATELAKVIQRTFDRGGNVVIPSFAVGRTQEMLYFIRKIKEDHMVTGHDGFEVWVDSPLAVEATNIFRERMYSDFDEEAKELLNRGINPIGFAGLKTSVTSEDSKNINFDPKPKVILSASGMCDAGRIKHHLKHNLWRPESTVLFVGYQAVRWISSLESKPEMVFVTHGEDTVCELFKNRLMDQLGLEASAPYSGAVFDLAQGRYLLEAEPIPIKKETAMGTVHTKASGIFAKLLEAGQRLMGVIRKNEGGANKDLKKFTEEINKLCDKWER